MACRWVKPPGSHQEPNLAMVDGSLIYWFLDGLPKGARENILPPNPNSLGTVTEITNSYSRLFKRIS